MFAVVASLSHICRQAQITMSNTSYWIL